MAEAFEETAVHMLSNRVSFGLINEQELQVSAD